MKTWVEEVYPYLQALAPRAFFIPPQLYGDI